MDTNSNVKLSNVIGAPFSDYVLLQLYIRAAHNSTVNRTNEDVLFLANKTAWARLVSSVNISNNLGKVYKDLGVSYSSPDSLAKNWVLEAGTSIQNGNGINLRSGIGPEGAYGLGGTEELGYRPMPGLTGVTIETTGRLGSLRQANIQFKVWNMNQLNVVEALYFRLGYSMLLEWGHTQYFDNKNISQQNEIYGINDPFASGQRKEFIQQAIARKSKNSFGNYDGMLGIVSNFTWAMNQEGGFDCTVKLVGLGSVMDSMRINQAYKLPDGLVAEYKKNKDALAQVVARQKELEAKLEYLKTHPVTASGSVVAKQQAIDPVPKNPTELKQRLQTYEHYQKFTVEDLKADYGIPYFNKVDNFTSAKTSGSYDYYTPFTNATPSNVKSTVITDYAGLWLNQGNSVGWARIPTTGVDAAVIDTALLNYAAASASVDVVGGGKKTIEQLSAGLAGDTYVSKFLDYVTGNTVSVHTEGLRSPTGYNIDIFYAIQAKTSTTPLDKDFQPTKQEIIKALDLWQSQNNPVINGVQVKSISQHSVLISGTFSQQIEAHYSGTKADEAATIRGNNDANARQDGKTRLVTVTFTFRTDNPGFIFKLGAPTQPKAAATGTNTQTANNGADNTTANQPNANQTDASEGFSSALQAMLTVIQAQAQTEAATNNFLCAAVPIKAQTDKFFQDGIMSGVLDKANTPEAITDLSNAKFNLVQYAAKGFNSDLMIDPTLYNMIPSVDFDNLCKAFIIGYTQGGLQGGSDMTQAPVYIPFGYLLAFLNNMCLIYDSSESKLPTNANASTGTPKRPYVYIDFNPETNFCLTSPQQLSVDPLTCLIPLDAGSGSYREIFPENIVKNWSSTATPIFNPGSNDNGVSGVLHAQGLYFKSKGNAYQGKVMNILLNIDYLLGLVKSSAGSDPEHAVKLEPFLQQILVDINKSLGNTNSFRAAYRDDSNTVQIQDDQWVPSLVGPQGQESSMLIAQKYNSTLKPNAQPTTSGLLPISGDPKEVPVAGNLGLARQFQIRSVMSTKLASMIAISAQANTGSVNAKDHSSLSYLNTNFQDRYKPYIQDASNGEAGSNTNSKTKANSEANDQKAAEMFNDHVINIYSNLKLSADKIELAKNYYIERMSKVKSGDPVVSAAPFIPAELEMTLDGISGIIMGNAFTIPQDRLPLSLRGENGLAKIAFIVTGLTHTIQSNEWLTKIKGQMIKLRQELYIPSATSIVGELQIIAPPPSTGTVISLTGAVIDDAITAIKSFEGLASAKPSKTPVYILDPTPTTTVYAYSESGDIPTIGWGTTHYLTGPNAGKRVTIKDSITVAQADAEIRAEVSSVYTFIQKNLNKFDSLTNGQKVSLISLAYNLGPAGLKNSKIWKAIESGLDTNSVANLIVGYGVTVKTTGQVAGGLVARRKQESQYYLS